MKNLFALVLTVISVHTFAQVKIGSAGSPNTNAVLELDGGTTKGLLLPRITNSDMIGAGFSSSPNGLIIYNSTDGFVYIRKASAWQKITDATNNGSFTLPYSGSAATTAGLNVFKIQNTNAGNAISGEAFGIGYGVYGYSASDAGGYFTSVSGPALLTGNGNVGIGNPLPTNAKLVVTGVNGSAQAIFGEGQTGISLESSNPLVGFNNYYRSGGRKYMATGYAGGLWMSTSDGSFSLDSYGTGNAGALIGLDAMTTLVKVMQNGNVGIGNTTPTLGGLVVDAKAGAINAMFGSNTTGVAIESNYPGIGFNSYYNSGRKAIRTGFGSLIGQDPNTGRFYVSTSAASVSGQGTAMALTDRLVITANGNIGVQGNDNPQSPLSFANFVGEKINFYEVNAASNYGIGIQGAQLQMYTGGATDAISFGYGSSAAFTERVRMQNGYTVMYNGRLQFKGQLSGGNAQGIEFTDMAGINVKNFIGVFDDNNIGFFGFGGVGWGFMWDGSDGSLRLGTTQKAAGYLLNVGGKIMAEEVRVQLRASWPDYVFSKDYKLQSLAEVEDYIAANNHLPNVPAAKEVAKSGIALGEMQSKMMEKIEELTLYILQLNKKLEQQANEISSLKKQDK
jgi:hypothetical protein